MSSGRSLRPGQVVGLVRAIEAGGSPTKLAREHGISRRTVYRWSKARIVVCYLEGWHALFAIRPEGGDVPEHPVQLTGWHREDDESQAAS